MLERIKNLRESFSRADKSRVFGIAYMVMALLAVSLFLMFSLNRVTVNDGNTTQNFLTFKTEAAELLKIAKLDSKNYKLTEFDANGKQINLSVAYTFPSYVTVGDTTHYVDLCKGETVADAIALAGITLDEHDVVSLSLDTVLNDTTYIDVTDINYVTEVISQKIPYTSKKVYSQKLSTTKVTTKGVEGQKEVTKVTKLVNGVVSSTEIVGENIVKPAVQEVITVGTKKPAVTTSSKVNCISELKPSKPIELDKNGNPVNYVKKVTVQATAYTESNRWHSASGVYLKPGHVAINTNLYKYGTKFYIKSSDGSYIYGYAVAADTGGFVNSRPTNFDLFFNTEAECRKFGRRNIEVWILE